MTLIGGRGRGPFVWAVCAVPLLALIAVFIPNYLAQEWSLWCIYGILALSLVLVWGHGGMISFGQAAFFGLGGYTYGVVSINALAASLSPLAALIVAAVIGGLVAAAIGYFMFYGNVGSVYVAVITLAFSLVLLTFFSGTADPRYRIGDAVIGGFNGMSGIPTMSLPGIGPLDPGQFFFMAGLLAVGAGFSVHLFRRSSFGRVVAGVRENEFRSSLLGYDVRRVKWVTFVVGGALAGFAGGLYAAWALFISPTVFGLGPAALVAIWVLVGGRTSVVGAFLGVILIQGLTGYLGEGGGSITPIVLGAVLIIVVLALPGGIVPQISSLLTGRRHLKRSLPPVVSTSGGLGAMPGVVAEAFERGGAVSVSTDEATKRFGGVTAVAGVSLDFAAGSIHCLIGPNGAGKSSYFKLLAGVYKPSSGRVYVDGKDISRLRVDQRASLGIATKMQVPMFYPGLTAHENVWLAAYGRFRVADKSTVIAAQVLEWMAISHRAETTAEELSHGEHQWLELGLVVASAPRFVLLDEPTAGMTRSETSRAVEIVRAISAYATVVAVEHDMEFVRELGAPVVVFHEGEVFAQGPVDEIRRDERVMDIYLGRKAAARD